MKRYCFGAFLLLVTAGVVAIQFPRRRPDQP